MQALHVRRSAGTTKQVLLRSTPGIVIGFGFSGACDPEELARMIRESGSGKHPRVAGSGGNGHETRINYARESGGELKALLRYTWTNIPDRKITRSDVFLPWHWSNGAALPESRAGLNTSKTRPYRANL